MCGASAKNTYKAMAKREKILLKSIAGCPISCKERIKMLVKVLFNTVVSNNHNDLNKNLP